jgi:hypothetical protein
VYEGWHAGGGGMVGGNGGWVGATNTGAFVGAGGATNGMAVGGTGVGGTGVGGMGVAVAGTDVAVAGSTVAVGEIVVPAGSGADAKAATTAGLSEDSSTGCFASPPTAAANSVRPTKLAPVQAKTFAHHLLGPLHHRQYVLAPREIKPTTPGFDMLPLLAPHPCETA